MNIREYPREHGVALISAAVVVALIVLTAHWLRPQRLASVPSPTPTAVPELRDDTTVVAPK